MLFFNTITIEDALKKIRVLDSSKAIQATDTEVKVIKGNSNFFVISMNLLVKENFLNV